MQKMEEVSRSKDRILSVLRAKGPCLPVQIAKEIDFSPLFASAFLSELKGEGKVKISNMRVGSSPLYYLPGQEGMLEKFSGYLNQREKEAFFHLRDKKVLEDSEQTPVMRVALRAIKDFAHSSKVRVGGESKTYWKYFDMSDEEVARTIRKGSVQSVRPKVEPPVEEVRKDIESGKEDSYGAIPSPSRGDGGDVGESVQGVSVLPTHPIGEKTNSGKSSEARGGVVKSSVASEVKEAESKSWLDGVSKEVQRVLKAEEERPLAEKKKAKVVESEFAINVKDYISAKDIEILEVISERKRDFEAVVRIDTMLGKQEFYLVAKDKKSVSDNDFVMALQKAQERKMLAAVFSTGEMNKKGKDHLEQWGNLVKFERLRF